MTNELQKEIQDLIDQKRKYEEIIACALECWRNRYYCIITQLRFDETVTVQAGRIVHPILGFATEDEYMEFVDACDDHVVSFHTIYHDNMSTYFPWLHSRFESQIRCPSCQKTFSKPRGLVPGRDVFCETCQGYFTYN